jgi:hypothetical protein
MYRTRHRPTLSPAGRNLRSRPGTAFARRSNSIRSIMHEFPPATQSLPSPTHPRAGVFWRKAMIFSKDYVGYLARQTVKHLVDAKMIETTKPAVLNEKVTAAMIEELALEDRINEEVRVILDAFQEDMRKTGASYPEMFKKVKNELARKYKAVL